jgi:hypothetical protein
VQRTKHQGKTAHGLELVHWELESGKLVVQLTTNLPIYQFTRNQFIIPVDEVTVPAEGQR